MDYNFIGIDLGSKTSITAHLRGNVNNIILNQIGGRETPVCISYSDQQRLFGEQAVVTTRSRPLSTILSPQRFLSLDPKQIEIQAEYSLAKFEKDHFHVVGNNLDYQVTPQEVVTAYLNYLISLTLSILQTTPTFYTLSVPNHLGYYARKELYKSFSAVVSNPPSLVSEKMAVGLDYLINTSKDKQTVLFVDFGHSKITAYVLKFTDNSIIELLEGSYSNLGVRCLDLQIVKFLESKIKFKLNQKAKLKLRDIAAKTRMILSANSEHIIQEDFGDNDFEYKMTREELQNICESPFSYIQNFLELTKKNIIQRNVKIDKMQVFGGGSRIPYFQHILSTIFKLPVRKAINNEAISRGCALYAHHRQKISKLGKIQLKQLLKNKIKLYINHYEKQPVGYSFHPKKAQNLETHTVYDIGSYNDDKKLTIQPRKNHSIELWFITEETQPMVEYYHIYHDLIDKETVNLNFDITLSEGYPKIRSVISQLKNPGLTKPVPFAYDSKEEIDSLRVKELEFRGKDLKIIAIQEKINKIESEVFRVREVYPEAEKFLENVRGMNVYELDLVLQQLAEIQ